MKTTTYTINNIGRAEIKKFLSENHKLGGGHFDEAMLSAWAADAEFNLAEGNPAIVEIRSFDTVSGHTEIYTISDSGIDALEISEE